MPFKWSRSHADPRSEYKRKRQSWHAHSVRWAVPADRRFRGRHRLTGNVEIRSLITTHIPNPAAFTNHGIETPSVSAPIYANNVSGLSFQRLLIYLRTFFFRLLRTIRISREKQKSQVPEKVKPSRAEGASSLWISLNLSRFFNLLLLPALLGSATEKK